VVRELKDGRDGSGGKDDYEHSVFASTNLSLTGKWLLKTYDLRKEIMEGRVMGDGGVHLHRPESDIVSCDMCVAVIQSVSGLCQHRGRRGLC